MTHKMFLSHNEKDKPIVEPVALRLAAIFGRDQVFYDSWSIRPGDGIIEEMNKGLEAPEFVFFFVSATSLASGLVKLEWQNALFAASKGKTRIVPVRVDGSTMPPVLLQTLYIDMHTVGMEVAITQIVNVCQGNATFTPQHLGFSNLTYSAEMLPTGVLSIVVKASHLLEPNPSFMVLLGNDESQFSCTEPATFTGGWNADIELTDLTRHNAFIIRPMSTSLTPKHPLKIKLEPKGSAKIDFRGVLHQAEHDKWVPLPRI